MALRSFARFLGIWLVPTLLLLSAARAQETWSLVSAPTTQNLWSVARGPNLFVAVGENGTLLTSTDGARWTLRSSGTTRWLVGATYANGLYAVVGDAGTILVSPDGVNWSPATSGTTARLNRIAFGGGRWLAVAESGEVLTSTNAITWTRLTPSTDRLRGLTHAYGQFVITGDNGLVRTTIDAAEIFPRALPEGLFVESIVYGRRRFVAVGENGYAVTSRDAVGWNRVSTGTNAYLRGVTYFNGRFIAVGESGTILTALDSEGPWTQRAAPSNALLTAVTASDTAAIAVGFGGAIFRSAPPPSVPTILVPPRSVNDVAGSNVLLEVVAAGSAPLEYEWSLNDRRLDVPSSPLLLISDLQSARTGTYSVRVRNALGEAPAASAVVSLLDPSAVGPIVDPAFVPAFASARAIHAAAEQPDRRVIIGGSELAIASSGTPVALVRLNPDGSVDPTFSSPLPATAVVHALVLQPDGRLLVGGDFTTPDGRRNLIRLNADGSLDPGFTAPANALGSPVRELSLTLDGAVFALVGERLLRFTSGGPLDIRFAPPPNLAMYLHAPLPDGRVLVATRATAAFQPHTLRRLNATTGAEEPGFSIAAPFNIEPGDFNFLHVLPDGRILVGTRYSRRSITSNFLNRYNPDGTADPSWRGISAASELTGSLNSSSVSGFITSAYAVLSDGRVLQAAASSNTRYVRRFNADGSRDTSFDERSGANGDVTRLFPLRDGTALVAGAFTSFDTVGRPGLARLVATNGVALQPPELVSISPTSFAVQPGETVTVTAVFAGSAPLAITSNWPVTVDRGVATIRIRTTASGTFIINLTASNRVGTLRSLPIALVVAESGPIPVTRPPAVAVVRPGRTARLTVDAVGSMPITYEWFRNGVSLGAGISNGSESSLLFPNATAADAGEYSVVIRNARGTATILTRLTVDNSPGLANLSTRATVAPGEQVLVTGFVLAGPGRKHVLIRGIGPGLAAFGVPGTLPDPTVTLYDSAGRAIATDNNWSTFDFSTGSNNVVAEDFAAAGAFALPNGSADAALRLTLDPGSYTLHVTDTANRGGIALAEIYDADGSPIRPADSLGTGTRLVNLSARAFVGAGANVVISGLVVHGDRPARYLIRAIGPSLSRFGVTSPIADPVLTLTTSTGAVVASNDNWSAPGAGDDLAATAVQVGAFPLDPASRDAALLVTLTPGNYTAQVAGAGNTTGIALVEIYEVP